MLVQGPAGGEGGVQVIHDGNDRTVREGDMLGAWEVAGICRTYAVEHDWQRPLPTLLLTRTS